MNVKSYTDIKKAVFNHRKPEPLKVLVSLLLSRIRKFAL